MLTSNKELRAILREAESAGWRFDKRKHHIIGKHPNGQTATISITPSDHRAVMNIKSSLKVRDGYTRG